MPVDTVKAREHHGSSSYDLTIPVEIKEKFEIRAGDVFQVTTEETNSGNVVIKYERVFEQPEEE